MSEVKMERGPMVGRMLEGDFEKDTITFHMPATYYLASGRYIIEPEADWICRRDQIAAATAKVEALEGDAARYRWLRDQNANVESVDAWTITRCDFTGAEGPDRYWVGIDLDTAIDAARLAPEDTTTAGEGNG